MYWQESGDMIHGKIKKNHLIALHYNTIMSTVASEVYVLCVSLINTVCGCQDVSRYWIYRSLRCAPGLAL